MTERKVCMDLTQNITYIYLFFIIGIGNDLHRRSMEMAEQEKLKAIRVAEQAVWAEAEQIKAVALQKAREEAAVDQDKAIKKMHRIHEKALKVMHS